MSTEPSPSLELAAVAALVGGTLRGDGARRITGVAPLDRAAAGDLSFVASARYLKALSETGAGALLVAPELAEAAGGPSDRVIVARPHEAILRVLGVLLPPAAPPFRGVHPSAVVAPDAAVAAGACVEAHAVVGSGARVEAGAWIGPGCHVGVGARVGADTRLVSQVTLYDGCAIGARGLIHAGTRIGSDGFGFVSDASGHHKIPHVGRVLIGDDVELGANCTIDRGSIDDTVIGDGTKLDNLVHIGHNVRVGRRCLMAAGVVIAGSARLEDDVRVAGQAAIGGHLTIGRGATITAKAGVLKDVPAGATWSGFPARPHREELRRQGAAAKLPSLLRQLEAAVGDEEAR